MLQSLWIFAINVAIIFIFVMWFWLLITVIGDLFSRHDVGGFKKVLWVIVLVLLPYLGVFIYLLTQSRGMATRNVERVNEARKHLREFIGTSPAQELEKLEALKASGAINPEEYSKLRARVIG